MEKVTLDILVWPPSCYENVLQRAYIDRLNFGLNITSRRMETTDCIISLKRMSSILWTFYLTLMIVQENLDFALPHIQFFDIFKQLFDILLPNIKTLTKTLIDTCFVTWNRSIQTLTKFYQILPFKGNFTNQTRRTLVIELNYRNVIHLFFFN